MGRAQEAIPLVSVVICHHRGRDLINRCLGSVFLSKGVRLDVIVVTSDSSYNENRVVQVYLEDGPAAKRNLGVRRAKSAYIIFLDDDVEISPYCILELYDWLIEHPNCGMAFAKIYKMEERKRNEFDDCGSWLTWTGFLYSRAENTLRDVGQFDCPVRCLAGKSATCIVRRSAFNQVGKFDSDYYILGEETDLAWRMWLRGWEVWYNPNAVSWHAFGCESLKPKETYYTNDRIFYRGCKNYLSLLWTNLGWTRLISIIPFQMSAWIIACFGFVVRGNSTQAMSIMRGMFDFFKSMPGLLRKRSHIQSTRVISDKELMKIVMYNPPLSYYFDRLKRYITQGLHG